MLKKERIKVELDKTFLFAGIKFNSDLLDEENNVILEKNKSMDEQLLKYLKENTNKKIYYYIEVYPHKQSFKNPMISSETFDEALDFIYKLENDIREKKTNIDDKKLNKIVENFIKDIKNNNNAYLNLLDLFNHDDYTYTHSINVSIISILIGITLNLDDEKLKILGVAGILHDIGKILIPPEIINKPGQLNEEEFRIMKNHPLYGYNYVFKLKKFNSLVENAILMHHEQYGGGGYLSGVDHENLEIYPQIISLADVFDALTTTRPYKKAWNLEEALIYIMENSGKKFNPKFTHIFLREIIKKFYKKPLFALNSYVLLNTGEVGIVVDYPKNNEFSLTPIINIFFNFNENKNKLSKDFIIDLSKDKSRYIIKSITDNFLIEKFNNMLNLNISSVKKEIIDDKDINSFY